MKILQSLLLLFVGLSLITLTSCSSGSGGDDNGPPAPSNGQLLLDNLTTVAAGEGWVIQSFTAEVTETWTQAGQLETAVGTFNYLEAVPFDGTSCGPDNIGDYMVFGAPNVLQILSGRDQTCDGDPITADQLLETATWQVIENTTTGEISLGISDFTPIELNFFITPLDPSGRYGDFATACFNPASQPYLFTLTSASPSASTLTFTFVVDCDLQNILFNTPGTFDLTATLTLSKTNIQ